MFIFERLTQPCLMQLTGTQVKLIKKSWEVFRTMNPAIPGDVFYSRLFLLNPNLEKLFKPSMQAQYTKLIDMLTLIVSRLERIDEVTSEIKELAIRHVEYGVKAKHYTAVGEALLWTLKQGLGNEWTNDLEQAWITCYQTLAGEMVDAAYTKK